MSRKALQITMERWWLLFRNGEAAALRESRGERERGEGCIVWEKNEWLRTQINKLKTNYQSHVKQRKTTTFSGDQRKPGRQDKEAQCGTVDRIPEEREFWGRGVRTSVDEAAMSQHWLPGFRNVSTQRWIILAETGWGGHKNTSCSIIYSDSNLLPKIRYCLK